MVIAHVINSLEGGGTERTLVSLLHAFDPSSLRHVVVTMRGAGSLAAQLPDHSACRPVSAFGPSRLAAFKLAGIVRTIGAGIIHARNTGCWFDAIVAGLLNPSARIVLGFHGFDAAGGLPRRRRCIARWGLRLGAEFTSVSEAGRRQLHEEAALPIDRITVLPNGVEVQRFGQTGPTVRRQIRRAFQLADTDFVVGTVGSLAPVKQHQTLISAIARAAGSAAPLRLLVVGDGPLRPALQTWARTEGVRDRVRFAGWREDIPELLSAMDTYVCSSESEGMSNALLEALAAGLPVIATKVGDNATVVRDHVDGLIVGPCSAEAVAAALLTLWRAPALCRAFGAASRERAQAYDFGRTVRAYEQYYRALLRAPPPVPGNLLTAAAAEPCVR